MVDVFLVIFFLLGAGLGIGFFINGTEMGPTSAPQQTVQYLSWVISALGWVIATVSLACSGLTTLHKDLEAIKKNATSDSTAMEVLKKAVLQAEKEKVQEP